MSSNYPEKEEQFSLVLLGTCIHMYDWVSTFNMCMVAYHFLEFYYQDI